MIEKFHCCASCVHFAVMKEKPKVTYKCTRLGYHTQPSYQFNCWVPKDHVKKLIEKRKRTPGQPLV